MHEHLRGKSGVAHYDGDQQGKDSNIPSSRLLRFQRSDAILERISYADKYEKDARKYWDIFYKRHQNKFFKDRHYLDKEWGHYFNVQDDQKIVVLEIGCGVGNTIFPLVSTYPNIFVHACDFSKRAVGLVKAHKEFTEDKVNAFICDVTSDDLIQNVSPFSVDIVTLVFMLSAVSPEKMCLVIKNIKKILKPNGRVLLRDYASGDLAQERLTSKDQKISESFYVRGDGTRVFYFSVDFLTNMFMKNGFYTEEVDVFCKQVENRSLELVMNRRWIQAVFSNTMPDYAKSIKEAYILTPEGNNKNVNHSTNSQNITAIDMSESIIQLFDVSPSIDELIEFRLRDSYFKIKALGREHQHTCKSTGLMLWESACLMSTLLSENPSIVAGKIVLELGCGSAGICSMVATQSAKFVVSTDGDTETLDLLKLNMIANLEPELHNKMIVKKLVWGNKEHVTAIKDLCNNEGGFETIIGTDVTYVAEAITPLFETARELISDGNVNAKTKPALVLCHMQRRVDEETIISTARQFGFKLSDIWYAHGMCAHPGSIINSWFAQLDSSHNHLLQNTPLNIMYFQM